jgi:hypothetical protein
MKKEKKEIVRLQNVIELDRFGGELNFNELIVKDLSKVLSDYFEFKGLPVLEIIKDRGEFLIKIKLTAVDVKRFGFISK